MRSNLRVFLLLSAIVLIPVLVLVGRSHFNGLYGQDPYGYYDYAMGPLRESLQAFEPPPPFFWPPGYPLLVSLLSLITGVGPLPGQLLSLAAGTVIPFLVYLMAGEIWFHPPSEAYGPILAGLLCACTGQLWQSSAVAMADTTALAAASLGSFSLLRYGKQPAARSGWLILAAGGFAYAILTRWAYALPALPASIYAIFILLQVPRPQALRQGAFATLAVVVILAPVLPSLLGQLRPTSPQGSAFVGDLEVYRWKLGTAFSSSHETSDGLLQYRFPNGLYYALTPAHRYYFTPLVALMLIPGVWVVLGKRTMGVWTLLLAWPAIVYLFHAGTPWQNFRFTLAFLTPLAILAALGFTELYERISHPRRTVLAALMAAGLFWMAAGGWVLTRGFIERNQRDLETARQVEENLPPGSQLIAFGLTLTIAHNTALETHEIFYLDDASLEALLGEGQPTFLLLDVGNVEQQWVGRAPESLYAKLRDGAGLRRVSEFDTYTLFQVVGGDI